MENQLSKIRNKKTLTFALIAFGLFVLTFTGVLILFYHSDNPVSLAPDDLQIVAKGQTLYNANCASCHGQKLEGQPNWKSRNDTGLMPAPPHDKSGHTWHHADVLLFELTKYGLSKVAGADYKSDMPVFAQKLSDQEIIAILSYIKSTWPRNIRKKHNQINQAYQQRTK